MRNILASLPGVPSSTVRRTIPFRSTAARSGLAGSPSLETLYGIETVFPVGPRQSERQNIRPGVETCLEGRGTFLRADQIQEVIEGFRDAFSMRGVSE